MSSYSLSTDMDPPVPTELSVTELDDGRMQFVSTEVGIGNDNAQDPDDLSDVQKARMVRLNFENTDCVDMEFAILPYEVPDSDPPPGTNGWSFGRNFMFSFIGSFQFECLRGLKQPPSVPPSPVPPP